ncbi:hypothetical protein GCM10027347_42090 [Larkinella harenae]
MKKVQPKSDFSSLRRYTIPAIFIALAVFFISNYYAETINPKDSEQAAFAATLLVFVGLYLGRYLSQLWISKPIPNTIFAVLSFLVIGSIIWLFVHAEFPLANRIALNLMLFYLPLFVLSVALGMLVKLGRIAVQNQIRNANARAEQSEVELHLLQSQLSPHFLFNTLNNLYGLSITQSDKIPPLLLKLSDLLRYSVYDAKELFVPLPDELAYIRNYIDFEKIRIGDRLTLSTSIEDFSQTNLTIAPMLLIVFIENAFKHSKNTTDPQISIAISIKSWGNSLLFSVWNSHGGTVSDEQHLEKNRGLGLSNVRKRLELLYPNAYELSVENGANFYNVMLQLKIK